MTETGETMRVVRDSDDEEAGLARIYEEERMARSMSDVCRTPTWAAQQQK
jgi:hypothetical protein